MAENESTSEWEGKTLSHFEDETGKKLDNLDMLSVLVMVFSDGSKIKLAPGWYGDECYWSQRS